LPLHSYRAPSLVPAWRFSGITACTELGFLCAWVVSWSRVMGFRVSVLRGEHLVCPRCLCLSGGQSS
jgi:hypothetical protein